MGTEAGEIHRGLKGVYFDTSEASFIDGSLGKLLYRGYNIHDLAEQSTFEEVTYLLLYGHLPTERELETLDSSLRDNRGLPEEVVDIIRLIKNCHPMDVLRTGISALSAFDPEAEDKSIDATRRKGIRLTSQAVSIVTAHHRIRQGLEPVNADPSLNHAGNFLYMLTGQKPMDQETNLMDVDFILHSEHGSNASAFAARVTASTLSDLHSAVVTGVGTLKGPLHGGAAESVMKMAQDIGDPANAENYARTTIENGERIMGFGHRVYRAEDPRARHLRERARVLGEQKGEPHWFQILMSLQEVMKPYQNKGIYVNVDFFAGAVYHLLGIPEDLFIPIFALGRIPGWTLQCMEQYENNVLIRPLTQYTGEMDLEYIAIDKRE
ncbi:MAG: citrate (Si)-synthase [Dehalococcoidia bacterium]|nr:citrate (Si)-synthase [Dehalococcoidia bacterium]